MPSLEGLEWGRLGMLAAGIVVVVLVLLLLTRACSGSSATSKNQAYFNEVKTVLGKSDAAGAQLHDLLNSQQPVKLKQVRARLTTMRAQAQSAVTAATNLKPTKQVASLQPWLLQTLSYRVNGLDCMITAMPQAYHAKPALAGGKLLVPCTQRMLASDIIYTDSYSAPATNTLHQDGIDVQVPTSVFLDESDAEVLTPAGMAAVLQRWKPSSAAHGLHGLSLNTVVAKQGDGKLVTLQAGTVNTVKVHGMSFLITATNGGDFTEYNIPVTLTIGTGANQVKKTVTIPKITKGQKETVSIGGFESTTLQFDKPVPLKVLVTPVPGERTASNNSQTYQVIFSL
ncbi:MAG TPA: hypothetical protein VFW26_13210 [Gaiellales bacterium]|jgi:hypothetical protein|nr:hypothetical protein [Gaiellales bacterium]